MGALVNEKTWQLDVDNLIAFPSVIQMHQDLIFAIKNALVSFATLPWTVISSSDSITAGASDKWLTSANMIWANAPTAHAWIVLQQGAGGGQLCIDLDNLSGILGIRLKAIWSPGGNFTGGTVNARPTATDEIDCMRDAQNYWAANQAIVSTQNILHVWHSTDGLVTRIGICRSGAMHTTWRFEAIKDPRTAHTNNPTVVGVVVATNGAADVSLAQMRNPGMYTEKDGTGLRVDVNFLCTSDGVSGGPLPLGSVGSVVEEWDSETYPLEEHLSSSTVGARGPKGGTYDSWLGQTQVMDTGDTMPVSATNREWAMFGPFIWPWTNGATAPVVT